MTTPATEQPRPFGVAVVGAGWMGHLHARSYLRLPHHWPELPVRPELVAVADPVPAARADAVRRYGYARAVADWRELLADPRIEAVSVTAPNSLHREIGVAVAEAGKHLWIEKPVGLTAADTRAVADAVRAAGVCATVGFNYRQVPAVQRARRLLAEGAIGTVTHARFRLLSDYAAHPAGSLTWRFQRATGGTGVLNDLAVHGVDLVRFLLGDLAEVVADTERVVRTRPLAAAGASQYDKVEGGPTGEVENDDYVAFLGRTTGRAVVVLEASRVAVGKQNDYGFEVQGERGTLAWDFRRPGELTVSTGTGYTDQSASLELSRPGDGDFARFQPGAGNGLSFDDTKVAECAAFVGGVLAGRSGGATLADAVADAAVLDAVAESAAKRAWVPVG
jgi:predicted dehydrogenase